MGRWPSSTWLDTAVRRGSSPYVGTDVRRQPLTIIAVVPGGMQGNNSMLPLRAYVRSSAASPCFVCSARGPPRPAHHSYRVVVPLRDLRQTCALRTRPEAHSCRRRPTMHTLDSDSPPLPSRHAPLVLCIQLRQTDAGTLDSESPRQGSSSTRSIGRCKAPVHTDAPAAEGFMGRDTEKQTSSAQGPCPAFSLSIVHFMERQNPDAEPSSCLRS